MNMPLAKKTRVLVVDDSALMRSVLRDCIQSDPSLEVVGMAGDGQRALDVVESLRPDVVTLDVQMPHLDGLATLDALLVRYPVPVIMVSSLTQQGAKTTLDALDRGAMDYVAKPERGGDVRSLLHDELVRKIHTVAGIDVRRILQIRRERSHKQSQAVVREPAAEAVPSDVGRLQEFCVAIGISTGGPPALTSLFETLKPPLPPIVVVQHMPPQFTKSLAWRLDSVGKLSVKEAESGDVLRPNHVLVAPGGKHLTVVRRGPWIKAVVEDGPPVSGHKPSADMLMHSAAKAFGPNCLGVIMTGMGRDGADGCRAIREAGGFVLGQDEATSDVYGMNKVAFVEGHVDQQFGLDEAAAVITRQIRRLGRPAAAVPLAAVRQT